MFKESYEEPGKPDPTPEPFNYWPFWLWSVAIALVCMVGVLIQAVWLP